MRFKREIGFSGSIEVVRTVLLDPDFREEVAREAGAVEVNVSIDERPDGTVLASVATAQPTDAFPAMARKVLGARLQIRQQEEWVALDRAGLVVELPGQPGRVTGTLALRADGLRTTQVVDAEIKVSIPFIGAKVEQLIASSLGYVLSLQEQVAARRLGS